MAEKYDGYLAFNTKVDTKGFDKGIEAVQESMKKTASAVQTVRPPSLFLSRLKLGLKAASAGLKALLKVIGVVGIAVLGLVSSLVALASSIVGAAIAGYKMAEAYTNKLASSLSKTSYMYDEIMKLKYAFIDVKETAKTLFSPLLIAAMPIIMKVTQWVIRLLNLMQKVIAAFLGQKTVMQYVVGSAKAMADETERMAAGTKKAGEAAEGALASFDELNVLQQAQEPTGGGEAGGGTGEFIEVPIEEEIIDKVETIKEKVIGIWTKVKECATNTWGWIKEKAIAAWDGISTVAQWVWDHILGPVWEWLKENATKAWGWIKENVLGPIGEKLEWLKGIIKESAKEIYDTFIKPVVDWFRDTVIPWFTTNVLPLIKKAWEGFVRFLANIWQLIKDSIASVWQFIVGIAKNWLTTISEVIQGVIRVIGGIIQFITGVFTGNWKKAWEGIKNIFGGVWDIMKAVFKGVVNSIIDIINLMIRAVVNGVNAVIRALNGVKVNIPDWVPVFGGQSFGINLSEVKAPQIPKLAKGAVIPPNAQFLALLGDQRQGKNLEAPEDLIRQIVKEESGGREITIQFAGSLGALVRELKPYIDGENARVGRSLVKRAVV